MALDRRRFLAGASAATAIAAIGMPAVHAGPKRSLKIGAYGGYFQDTFVASIYPDFTKATGIEVEPIAEPTGEAWVVQLDSAAKSGIAPADVSIIANADLLRGSSTSLWAALDVAKIPNSKFIKPNFMYRSKDGQLNAVGAVSWYITLVTNTQAYPTAPTSWTELWNPKNKDRLGLLALASNSYLLDIAAQTFFGGTEMLSGKEGIDKAIAKVAELKPNVKLWYRDEAQFEQALKSGEVPMGQYYHDVTGLAVKDGFPVRSSFPKEGAVVEWGCWGVSKASKKLDEAHIFIDYMSQPKIQSALARTVGVAPVVERSLLDLTDAEFHAVSSDIKPIVPRYDIYVSAMNDYISQKWSEAITG
jgi:putative spermidine/putrescine transport system substrate-binding protein